MLSRGARPALRAGAAASVRPQAAPAANYATLREIEQRLKSIKNIQKITNTMKVVASTKLSRAQRVMNESRVYGRTAKQVFDEAETQPLEDEEKKQLIIVCSSDKGLCGGVHSGLTRAVRGMLQTKKADLVVLGEKGRAQLSRSHPKSIRLSFSGIGKNVPTFADAQAICDQVTLLDGDYTSIQILYNRFVNAQSYQPTCVEAFNEAAIQQSKNIETFEMDDEVLPNLQEYSLANQLYWALAEGHAAEQSARRNAMDNATKNAGEMIDKYTIIYNRTRQAVITGELVEIITGAAASEDG